MAETVFPSPLICEICEICGLSLIFGFWVNLTGGLRSRITKKGSSGHRGEDPCNNDCEEDNPGQHQEDKPIFFPRIEPTFRLGRRSNRRVRARRVLRFLRERSPASQVLTPGADALWAMFRPKFKRPINCGEELSRILLPSQTLRHWYKRIPAEAVRRIGKPFPGQHRREKNHSD